MLKIFTIFILTFSALPTFSSPINWKKDWFLLDHAGFEYSRYLINRDPYVPEIAPRDWEHRMAFDMDVRLAPIIKWTNTIHTSGDKGAVHHVGWEFEFVMDYFNQVQPFYYHHSQHVMEYERPPASFPLVDRYGLRFNFYDRRRR